MPSFDLVSKLDMGEMKNVVNMAQKQISGRYDFKGSNTSIDFKGEEALEIKASDDYKMTAALDILRQNMAKRNVGMRSIDPQDIEPSGNQMFKQTILIKAGIDKEQGKKINKAIKESGIKVTSSYLDEKVRVQGKKIDDLQAVFQYLKSHKDVVVDLQMENMKR
ncbi:YajQ family cyclic di-GMP-binding protein [Halobacteriovorax sp. GB3]|uniref:YajQ family cyclic di-GMP-binding protein n=1 Tax=Halobacteriovorax sp. GB3 TaxID=2719615 RepID=UPI0023631030|nr:YajQ family cyclic di-GMP-binding protein [Halobacteriovorax sp. GB3]MDD0852087.1 YajQ family cyclic di-GMP-binding protein [Halobacteriovorax sp. GB3]